MSWSKFNMMSNLTPRYFIESNGFIGQAFMKIFRNAGCVFILAVDILMSYVLVEFNSKLFIVSQLFNLVRQFCS